MHTYHRIAVEAFDEEDAKGRALQFAESQEWSDWMSIVEDSRLEDIKAVTNYKENPTGFTELVEQACKWTKECIGEVVKEYGEVSLKEILTNPKYDFAGYEGQPSPDLTQEQKDKRLTDSLAVFRIGRALKVLNSEYGQDTMFYDAREYTPNPKYLNERCESNPEEQWIVIVDYHF
jgi:hypothetical protein